VGFPIRRSPAQSLFSDSPELIAASHVLHRLPAPRHPPYALSNLTIKFSQDKESAAFKLSKISFPIYAFPDTFGEMISLNRKSMVELTGIEPATSGMQNRRSPS
jgi:hypothetical protein